MTTNSPRCSFALLYILTTGCPLLPAVCASVLFLGLQGLQAMSGLWQDSALSHRFICRKRSGGSAAPVEGVTKSLG